MKISSFLSLIALSLAILDRSYYDALGTPSLTQKFP